MMSSGKDNPLGDDDSAFSSREDNMHLYERSSLSHESDSLSGTGTSSGVYCSTDDITAETSLDSDSLTLYHHNKDISDSFTTLVSRSSHAYKVRGWFRRYPVLAVVIGLLLVTIIVVAILFGVVFHRVRQPPRSTWSSTRNAPSLTTALVPGYLPHEAQHSAELTPSSFAKPAIPVPTTRSPVVEWKANSTYQDTNETPVEFPDLLDENPEGNNQSVRATPPPCLRPLDRASSDDWSSAPQIVDGHPIQKPTSSDCHWMIGPKSIVDHLPTHLPMMSWNATDSYAVGCYFTMRQIWRVKIPNCDHPLVAEPAHGFTDQVPYLLLYPLNRNEPCGEHIPVARCNATDDQMDEWERSNNVIGTIPDARNKCMEIKRNITHPEAGTLARGLQQTIQFEESWLRSPTFNYQGPGGRAAMLFGRRGRTRGVTADTACFAVVSFHLSAVSPFSTLRPLFRGPHADAVLRLMPTQPNCDSFWGCGAHTFSRETFKQLFKQTPEPSSTTRGHRTSSNPPQTHLRT